jgi:predicted short-subunit dehydrogenase-like oxidoreductase (DUF2520 family)
VNFLQRERSEHAMLSLCMSRSVSIVGAGRLGRALGRSLRRLGWRIGAVVTRSAAHSRAAVRAIGAGRPLATLTSKVMDADVILLMTPDDVLTEVARQLARVAGKKCRGKTVLHGSGALDNSVLQALARCGAATGSIHPMQTFTNNSQPNLKGVIFAIEGQPRARRAAGAIARSLGGIPVPVASSSKPAYHAAGTLVAGHALALTEAAAQTLIRLGFTRMQAMQTLLPLMRQMLHNFEKHGPRAAWTGPASRGDYATLKKHQQALRRQPREFSESYAALLRLSARVLAKNPAATLKKLDRAFKNSRRNSK